MMVSKSEFGVKIRRNKKPCAACKYYKKKCLPGCPFAPIFPSDEGGEEFQNVIKVFGKSNFRKLIKSAGTEQCLAAKTLMIMKARGRISDPAFVNQQNQFHSRRSVVPQQEWRQHRLNEAKEASSSTLGAVPSPSLQEIGSGLSQNDELSNFLTTQVDYNDIKPFTSLLSAYTTLRDTEMKHHNKDFDGLKENFNQSSCGVVLKRSSDAKGLIKTVVQGYKDVVKNPKDHVHLSQENNRSIKCFRDVEEPAWSFSLENKADVKKCTDYNECTTAEFSRYIKQEQELCSLDYMGKNEKGCAACKYRREKCLHECPFAPIFPQDREKDFQNVVRVFGASRFIRLMESAAKSQQHLAAKAMIIEANARVSDPVHGLGGFAMSLSEQLDYLSSELDLVNQQIECLRQTRQAMD